MNGMRLTDNERLELWGMRHSFTAADIPRAVGEFTQGVSELLQSGDPDSIYRALAGIEEVKSVFQRVHNYNHTIGMLAAKTFLECEFPTLAWDRIEFADHANRAGPDIRIVWPPVRIIGELKTTEPCGRTKSGTAPMKFGSRQREEIEKDLRSLADAKYDAFARYMFVTTGLAYHCLTRDYRTDYPTICFVHLSATPEVSRPAAAMAQ